MIRRHSLVWLQDREATARSAAAKSWQSTDQPFMVCRTRPGEELSLGYCLPSLDGEGSPQRMAVPAALADVARVSRPPDLLELSAKLDLPPNGWDVLKTLPEGCTARLIGSRLWEVLTGERYVRKTSDLDLVVDLKDSSLADAAAEFMASVSGQFPVPVDGELSFPGHGEVHWKEWLSGSAQVLLKAVDRVALVHRAELTSAPRHEQSLTSA